ncbi:hypothetical protein P171DRAFT_486336 [Karstenula rhodostoma CBS 690.94]|uniref:Uncharacterized protein n=1 Tax=Karstenula rhodostoma CBS 690.94 TaxID=1392251 RepID=A0A9P4PGB4_9PLEO|nr:hypothetical protein P171DRAFT_486336 [Karstenula rhodostoma CBS 690.94]
MDGFVQNYPLNTGHHDHSKIQWSMLGVCLLLVYSNTLIALQTSLTSIMVSVANMTMNELFNGSSSFSKNNDSLNNLSKNNNFRQDINPVFYTPSGIYIGQYSVSQAQFFVIWTLVLIAIALYLHHRMKSKLKKRIIFLENLYDKATGVAKNPTHYGPPSAKRQRLMDDVEVDHYYSPEAVELQRKNKHLHRQLLSYQKQNHNLARRLQHLSLRQVASDRLDEIDAYMRENGYSKVMRGPKGFFMAMDPAALVRHENRECEKEVAKKQEELGTFDYRLRHRRFYPFVEDHQYWMRFWHATDVMPPYPINIYGEPMGRTIGEVAGEERKDDDGKMVFWKGF